ncbi:hypothetical protein SAMN05660461_4872 [Chitinophaga ginsengisegetis]|uniref:Uncharacterized protein n=1 Tax=Chitinophaga ginsengisegetis TaxID=393003 RepID=A0A1T5P8B3_9BACT|nr:hypothetical protein SAMN05660461_4872 [Chitinophaga ginsengisegetis]
MLSILFGIQLLSCKKGTVLEGEKFVEVYIPFVFNTGDTLDLLVDGKLAQTQTTSRSFFNVVLKQKDQLNISIRKTGSTEVLKDTTVTVSSEKISLGYAYEPSLGFNRFVKPGDFERPSSDSIAFILINKYTGFGSGKINVTIYRNNSKDYTANPADSVTTIKNIALGTMSEKIVLPANSGDGTKNLYVIIVRDAVSGVDGYQEYYTDYGMPANSASVFINEDNAASAVSGVINGISIVPYIYDTGSKIYALPDVTVTFQL